MQDRLNRRRGEVERLRHYLLPGEYRFDNSGRAFCLFSQAESMILQMAGECDPQNRLLLSGADGSRFDGHLVWFSMSGDVKILSTSRVLTLCQSREAWLRKRDIHRYFSRYLPLPEIVATREDANTITEARIAAREVKIADELPLIQAVFDDYERYFSQVKANNHYRLQPLAAQLHDNGEQELNALCSSLISGIAPALLTQPLPWMRLHGDLWTGNILLLDSDAFAICYIDWDESAEYPFFYDLFKFIWNELDVNQRTRYYRDYMTGNYDAFFSRIFAQFDLQFDLALRKDYLNLFMLSYLMNSGSGIPDACRKGETADFLRKTAAELA
ncbi:hypothetical protein B5M10_14475 [Pluralibacter gergoviae]|nr:hypothetical protein SS31_07285 [Pluralibacter gergoviae]OUQ99987.1 hypothetical protein B5M10_14475 [Pluralibacter gergoviae]